MSPAVRVTNPYTEVSAPVAERATVPFPRTVSDASGATLVIPRQPQRIISQTLGTDEILLALCDPHRIVALSALVDDETYSNVTEQARQVTRRMHAGTEQILYFQPNMIFVASYSKAELVELLKTVYAPVFRFAHFDHIDDIKLNIRTIGYIIGETTKPKPCPAHGARHGKDASQHSTRYATCACDVIRASGLYWGSTHEVR